MHGEVLDNGEEFILDPVTRAIIEGRRQNRRTKTRRDLLPGQGSETTNQAQTAAQPESSGELVGTTQS